MKFLLCTCRFDGVLMVVILESGKELTKKTRHCSKCKRAGHYANNCRLDKENDPSSTGALKKK
ncbi:Splicing factor 1 [Bienertia sinuspersici]